MYSIFTKKNPLELLFCYCICKLNSYYWKQAYTGNAAGGPHAIVSVIGVLHILPPLWLAPCRGGGACVFR